MKVSESTVKRVRRYWIKNHQHLPIKKFGRKSQELEEESVELILETHKKQKLGARRLEKIIEFEHGIIKHITARVKHPQTNGKIEKWYDTYEKYRFKFENFDKFVNWYDTVRYHESLDTDHYLMTPNEALWARLPEECELNIFLVRMESELRCT